MTRLYDRYTNEVVPALKKEFGYTNPMEIPRLEKIVLNVGLGDAVSNAKLIEVVVNEIGAITGQKAVVTKAQRAVSNISTGVVQMPSAPASPTPSAWRNRPEKATNTSRWARYIP